MRRAFYRALDERVFPRLVAYMSAREHIIAVLFLLVVLLNPGDPIALVLALNSYLNVMSVATASVISRQQAVHTTIARDSHEAHSDAFEQILVEIAALRAEVAAGRGSIPR